MPAQLDRPVSSSAQRIALPLLTGLLLVACGGTTPVGNPPDSGTPDAGPSKPANLAYATPVATWTVGTPIEADHPSSTGGAISTYSVAPALPAGVALDPSTGVVSGTPTVPAPQATYTVTGANAAGSATATLSIAVNDVPPEGLAYSGALVCTRGEACALPAPTHGGGGVDGYAITPALPAGLAFDASTGAISGTPTGISTARDYTVTATSATGSASTTLTVTVNRAAIQLTGAVPVDAPPAGAIATVRGAVSATDGTNHLFVWEDDRTDGTGRLFAARLGPDGTVLDPAGVQLDQVSNGFMSASVVWAGSFYFVCDRQYVNGAAGQTVSLGCFTLSPDLTVRGPREELVSGQGLTGSGVAWDPDDQQILVAWIVKDYPNKSSPFTGVRFDASGARIDATPVTLRPSGGGAYDYDRSFVSLAYGGGYYLITSSEGSGGCGGGYHLDTTRVKASDLSGGADYGSPNPNCTSQTQGQLAYDPSANQFLALVGESASGTALYLQPISNEPGDTTMAALARTTVVPPTTGGFYLTGATLAVNGASSLVAVSANTPAVTAYSLNATHQLTGSVDLATPAPAAGETYAASQPTVTASGTGWVVGFTDNRVEAGLYAVRLAGDLSTGDGAGILAASGIPSEAAPCVASAGEGAGWLVAWTQQGGSPSLWARRFADDGTPLDAAPVRLGSSVSAGAPACAAAYASGTYLVSWEPGDGRIVAARLDAQTGAVQDALPIELGMAGRIAPSAAGGPEGFLVGWAGPESACSGPFCHLQVLATHVGREGVVAEPGGFQVPDLSAFPPGTALDAVGTSVVFDGTSFQVAFALKVEHASTGIYSRAVPTTGAPTGDTTLVATLDTPSVLGPSMATATGGGSLIAWTAFDGDGGASVQARAVVDGVAQGAEPVVLVSGSGATTPGVPRLAFDGVQTWLALVSGPITYAYFGLASTGPASLSLRPIDDRLAAGAAVSINDDTGLTLPIIGLAGNGAGALLEASPAFDPAPDVLASRVSLRHIQ